MYIKIPLLYIIMALPFIYNIENRESFVKSLETNPGLIIVKFGATWCGPCKKIAPLVDYWMDKMPQNVQCYIIDVDEDLELYGFLYKKKMVHGVPAIVCYEKGNVNYIPNDAVIGADDKKVTDFFARCLEKATSME